MSVSTRGARARARARAVAGSEGQGAVGKVAAAIVAGGGARVGEGVYAQPEAAGSDAAVGAAGSVAAVGAAGSVAAAGGQRSGAQDAAECSAAPGGSGAGQRGAAGEDVGGATGAGMGRSSVVAAAERTGVAAVAAAAANAGASAGGPAAALSGAGGALGAAAARPGQGAGAGPGDVPSAVPGTPAGSDNDSTASDDSAASRESAAARERVARGVSYREYRELRAADRRAKVRRAEEQRRGQARQARPLAGAETAGGGAAAGGVRMAEGAALARASATGGAEAAWLVGRGGRRARRQAGGGAAVDGASHAGNGDAAIIAAQDAAVEASARRDRGRAARRAQEAADAARDAIHQQAREEEDAAARLQGAALRDARVAAAERRASQRARAPTFGGVKRGEDGRFLGDDDEVEPLPSGRADACQPGSGAAVGSEAASALPAPPAVAVQSRGRGDDAPVVESCGQPGEFARDGAAAARPWARQVADVRCASWASDDEQPAPDLRVREEKSAHAADTAAATAAPDEEVQLVEQRAPRSTARADDPLIVDAARAVRVARSGDVVRACKSAYKSGTLVMKQFHNVEYLGTVQGRRGGGPVDGSNFDWIFQVVYQDGDWEEVAMEELAALALRLVSFPDVAVAAYGRARMGSAHDADVAEQALGRRLQDSADDLVVCQRRGCNHLGTRRFGVCSRYCARLLGYDDAGQHGPRCYFQGCMRPAYKSDGEEHAFCGRTHGYLFAQMASTVAIASMAKMLCAPALLLLTNAGANREASSATASLARAAIKDVADAKVPTANKPDVALASVALAGQVGAMLRRLDAQEVRVAGRRAGAASDSDSDWVPQPSDEEPPAEVLFPYPEGTPVSVRMTGTDGKLTRKYEPGTVGPHLAQGIMFVKMDACTSGLMMPFSKEEAAKCVVYRVHDPSVVAPGGPRSEGPARAAEERRQRRRRRAQAKDAALRSSLARTAVAEQQRRADAAEQARQAAAATQQRQANAAEEARQEAARRAARARRHAGVQPAERAAAMSRVEAHMRRYGDGKNATTLQAPVREVARVAKLLESALMACKNGDGEYEQALMDWARICDPCQKPRISSLQRAGPGGKPEFEVTVLWGCRVSSGVGTSKRMAQRRAAWHLLGALEAEVNLAAADDAAAAGSDGDDAQSRTDPLAAGCEAGRPHDSAPALHPMMLGGTPLLQRDNVRVWSRSTNRWWDNGLVVCLTNGRSKHRKPGTADAEFYKNGELVVTYGPEMERMSKLLRPRDVKATLQRPAPAEGADGAADAASEDGGGAVVNGDWQFSREAWNEQCDRIQAEMAAGDTERAVIHQRVHGAGSAAAGDAARAAARDEAQAAVRAGSTQADAQRQHAGLVRRQAQAAVRSAHQLLESAGRLSGEAARGEMREAHQQLAFAQRQLGATGRPHYAEAARRGAAVAGRGPRDVAASSIRGLINTELAAAGQWPASALGGLGGARAREASAAAFDAYAPALPPRSARAANVVDGQQLWLPGYDMAAGVSARVQFIGDQVVVARQGDAMIYDDEMDLLLGSRVRQAEPREHPSAMFVQLLQQRAAYGHRAASTRLDFRTGTLVRDDNKKFFRQIYAIETMDNMAADLRNVLGQRRTMLEELLRRQAHAGVEFNLCQRAIDNVTRVLSMMRRFFEKMHSKYQRVLAHGISFAERKKRSARFFQYVNLVFYHFKFTLDREPHIAVFFSDWSEPMWELAENAVLTSFVVPPRCADNNAARQAALLRVMSEAGGGAGTSFDMAMADASQWTQRQWATLMRRNGRQQAAPGGRQRAAPRPAANRRTQRGGDGRGAGRGAGRGSGRGAGRGRGGRGTARPGRNRRGNYSIENVKCYNCQKFGHYQAECPNAAAATGAA
jgi:hypothetical protein